MLVEIWSDVVCPWCYIGKRRFEAALAAFEHGDEVDVVWRSFELDPHAPTEREGGYAERLAGKYGVGLGEAQAMIARMVGAAAGEGVEMRFDIARPGNTFDAHRVLHRARGDGLQSELKERLLAATFTEGQPIGDEATLIRLAVDVGLAEAEVSALLEGDALREDVRSDEEDAGRLGVTGVPFFAIDRRYGVAGAQSADVLLSALERAWSEAQAGAQQR